MINTARVELELQEIDNVCISTEVEIAYSYEILTRYEGYPEEEYLVDEVELVLDPTQSYIDSELYLENDNGSIEITPDNPLNKTIEKQIISWITSTPQGISLVEDAIEEEFQSHLEQSLGI